VKNTGGIGPTKLILIMKAIIKLNFVKENYYKSDLIGQNLSSKKIFFFFVKTVPGKTTMQAALVIKTRSRKEEKMKS
jgi:hypothetical protein